MREIALHILDLAENSIRSGAETIAITVEADAEADLLTVTVEDDGPGFCVPPSVAADPFYTTKPGKRVGLGLSLFRAACEQSGGVLAIDHSPLGGARVRAVLGLGHVDRTPMGDLAGTLAALACANPQVDFRFHLHCGAQECFVSVRDIAQQCRKDGESTAGLARHLEDRISAACCIDP